MSAPCPVCDLPYGFHDMDEPDGRHAAARARIPDALKRPSNKAVRRMQRAWDAAMDETMRDLLDGVTA